MEIDVFIPGVKIGVEYDGRHYHNDAKRDFEKNRRCARAGIELIRFREKGCPEMIGVTVIEINSKDIDSLSNGISELVLYINNKYGLNINIQINLKKDLNAIMEKKYISRKKKSLANVYPEIASMLHPDNKIRPTAIPYRSNQYLIWKCPNCSYEWSAAVTSVVNSYRKHRRTGCPRCAGKILIVGENDAATLDPIAASCWDSEHNLDQLSDHLSSDLEYKWWICSKCKDSFKRQICVMCRNGTTHLCEPCSKIEASKNRFKKVTETGNNLLEKNPEIAKYWDYERNDDRPEDYTPNSEKMKWWICSRCNKPYQSMIIVRTRENSTECFACSRKRGGEKTRINALQNGANTLAKKYPGLAKQWHPSLNGNLSPSDIPPNYAEKIWWYCDTCKQSWDRSPAVRIRNGDSDPCPICSGKRYCKGVNDIATLHPNLVIAWHPSLNRTKRPEDYRSNDDTKVYWMCPNCGKEQLSKIRDKTKSNSPLCKGCKIKDTKLKTKENGL